MSMFTKPSGARVLTPETQPCLTNGEVFSDRVVLGIHADANAWREASREEYEEAVAEPTDPDNEEITAEEALDIIMGGRQNEA